MEIPPRSIPRQPSYIAVICKTSGDFVTYMDKHGITDASKYKIATSYNHVAGYNISEIQVEFHGFRGDSSWLDIYNQIAISNNLNPIIVKEPRGASESETRAHTRHQEIVNDMRSRVDSRRFSKEFIADLSPKTSHGKPNYGYNSDHETLGDQFIHRTNQIIKAPENLMMLIFKNIRKFNVMKALRFLTAEIREKQETKIKVEVEYS